MSQRIQRIRQFVYLSGLALSLAGLFLGSGCSKGVLEKRPVPEKTWICDKAADDAMKQQDYEAAIPLHQRLLESMLVLCLVFLGIGDLEFINNPQLTIHN